MAVMVPLLYALDQFTKHLAVDRLTVGQPVEVIPGLLWFSLHFNPGAAFSMGTQFTVVLSVLVLGVLAGLLGSLHPGYAVGWPRWASAG